MNDELPPLYTATEEKLRDKLRAARRLNAVAATVADGYRHALDTASPVQGVPVTLVPLDMVRDMLDGVIAALGGETDPDRLHLHPEINLTHRTTLTHLRTASLEDR